MNREYLFLFFKEFFGKINNYCNNIFGRLKSVKNWFFLDYKIFLCILFDNSIIMKIINCTSVRLMLLLVVGVTARIP